MALWWMPLRRQWMTPPRTFHCWRNWLKFEAIGGIFHIGDFECQRFSTDVEKRHSAISVEGVWLPWRGSRQGKEGLFHKFHEAKWFHCFTLRFALRENASSKQVLHIFWSSFGLAHHNHHTSMRITSYHPTQHCCIAAPAAPAARWLFAWDAVGFVGAPRRQGSQKGEGSIEASLERSKSL
jgi:hypothetical protein